MTQHNPDEVARLIAEAREDDERMTPGPWRPGAHERDAVYCALGAHMHTERVLLRVNSRSDQYRDVDAAAIARTRNNLRAMADQLEAARREIEAERTTTARWSRECDRLIAERDKLRAELEASAARIARLESEHDTLCLVVERTTGTIDKLTATRAELEAARREVAVMRPVVEAAERLRDGSPLASAGQLTIDLDNAVDAYRAARDKAGDLSWGRQ